MDKTMNVDLKFLKSWGSYNVGEAARFADNIAEALIRKGIAIEHRVEAALQTAVDAVRGTAAAKADDKTKQASK
jgi:hypothetical protein